MNIVFCPSITDEIRVQRSGLYVQLCLVGQSGDTFVFVFDDDTLDHLIDELVYYAYEDKDAFADECEVETDIGWSVLRDMPF